MQKPSKEKISKSLNDTWCIKPGSLEDETISEHGNRYNGNHYRTNDRHKQKLGRDWFNDGKLISDAPYNLRDDVYFLKGYEQAKEISFDTYCIGLQYYIDGKDENLIPEIYSNKAAFWEGYSDARDICLIYGVSVPLVPDNEELEMYLKGKKWAKNGKPFETAPKECQYSTYFLDGYEKFFADNKCNKR